MEKRVLLITAVTASLAASACAAASESHQAVGTQRAGDISTSAAVPTRCPHIGRYEPVDPRDARALPTDGLAHATEAALRYFDTSGSAVEHGAIAMAAQRDPSSASYWCGALIASRTVEVDLTFPSAPSGSASLSTGKVLVSQFSGGRYAVWLALHG